MSGIINQMRCVVTEIIDDDEQSKAIVYALIQQFGGERFYLPSNDYEMRNREIKVLHQAGVKHEILAKRFGLSVKTIYRIVK